MENAANEITKLQRSLVRAERNVRSRGEGKVLRVTIRSEFGVRVLVSTHMSDTVVVFIFIRFNIMRL